jgi:hypothetical protein
MSRRYWLPIIAAVGLILVGPTEGKAVTALPENPPANSAALAAPPALAPDIKRIAGALEAEARKPPSDYDRRNTEAQENVAWWTPWIAIVATIEIIITALGVGLVGATLFHTKRAADAAEKTVRAMVAIDRPYLWGENFEVGEIKKSSFESDGSIVEGRIISLFGEVRNCGSRFAVLDGFAAGETVDGLPVPILMAREMENFAPYTISPDASRSWDVPLTVFGLEEAKFGEIMAARRSWYIYGHFRYRDANRVSRKAGFAFEFWRGELFEGGRLKLFPSGPAEYWYDREVTPEDNA